MGFEAGDALMFAPDARLKAAAKKEASPAFPADPLSPITA